METSKPLEKELIFRTSRSSGRGGQNVNKVSTKVELIFDVKDSFLFSEDEKQSILSHAGKYVKDDGFIHIVCSEERSQYLNKKKAVKKLIDLIEKAFKPVKDRIPTEVPEEEKEKRFKDKKIQSEKKQSRRLFSNDH